MIGTLKDFKSFFSENILIILISLILIFLVFFIKINFIPFTKDFARIPNSSLYSEQNGLLVSRFQTPDFVFEIGQNNYKIIDAWASYNFTDNTNTEVRDDIILIILKLKNISTESENIPPNFIFEKNSIRIDLSNFSNEKSKNSFSNTSGLLVLFLKKEEVFSDLDYIQIIYNVDGIENQKLSLHKK